MTAAAALTKIFTQCGYPQCGLSRSQNPVKITRKIEFALHYSLAAPTKLQLAKALNTLLLLAHIQRHMNMLSSRPTFTLTGCQTHCQYRSLTPLECVRLPCCQDRQTVQGASVGLLERNVRCCQFNCQHPTACGTNFKKVILACS